MQVFEILVALLTLWLTPATCQVQLSSSGVETKPCPGETVTFTCSVTNKAQLRWIVDPESPAVNPITFLPEHSAGKAVNRGNLSATLTTIQRNPMNILAANMTSTLTYRGCRNDTRIICEDQSLLLIVSATAHPLTACVSSPASSCSGPPAAPTSVSGVWSLTCDAHQLSQVVNVSWEFEAPSDANCTNCTAFSMTAGYTSHQLVCNGRTTIAVKLNCGDIYTISLTAINQCGQQSDQTAVEVTLSRTGTTTLPTGSDTHPTDITNGTETPHTPGETNPDRPLDVVIGVVAFLFVAVVVIAIVVLLVRKSKKKTSLRDRSQSRRVDEEKDGCTGRFLGHLLLIQTHLMTITCTSQD